MIALLIAGLGVGGMSEILVSSISDAASSIGLSEFFVGAIVVAIVGNAAEHWVAVLVALKDAKRYGATSVLLVPGVVKKGKVEYDDCFQRSVAEILAERDDSARRPGERSFSRERLRSSAAPRRWPRRARSRRR